MFYVMKNEIEMVKEFRSLIDARLFIESFPNFTDMGDYGYIVGEDVYEIVMG